MYDPLDQTTAPPRRKSCEACKTAKRRCDLAFPTCSRCTHRNVSCVYPGRQPQPNLGTITEISSILDCPGELPPLDLVECTAEADLISGGIEAQLNHLDPLQTLATEPTLDLEISPSFELTVPRAAPPKSLSGIIASRLQFAIDLIKDAPRMMVAENQTPWCHRQLYKNGMPRVMQDAYTCCSLYLNKNEMNAPVVMSILESRTRDLLSLPIPTSPLDILARTQAIILYKIMHLFDGNTRSHFAIESLSAALDSSAMSLHGYLHFPDPSHPTQLFPTSMEPIMNFWDTWIFQESAWRTVLLTLYFHQVYNVLQGRIPTVCDGKLGLTHAWYLSAHLWNSQSAFDFAIAWMEKPHFVVYDADFSSVLCDAQPSDVDAFGRMWLVTLLGIDEAKAWFYSRGALL